MAIPKQEDDSGTPSIEDSALRAANAIMHADYTLVSKNPVDQVRQLVEDANLVAGEYIRLRAGGS